jgi:hypothetical protein
MTFGRSKGSVDYENLKRFIYSNAGAPPYISPKERGAFYPGCFQWRLLMISFFARTFLSASNSGIS